MIVVPVLYDACVRLAGSIRRIRSTASDHRPRYLSRV